MIFCEYQKKEVPLFLPFGGGVNSTAMILGALERGIEIDFICFADTGGEHPETYAWIETLNQWLKDNHNLEIHIARCVYKGKVTSLEDFAVSYKSLPSLAYGFKSCSLKFKAEPSDKLFISKYKDWMKGTGSKPIKWIGYDLDEEHRYKNRQKEYAKFVLEFPLIEWGLDREGCKDLIEKHGFEPPKKSACFFCPASKKHEIEWLAENHPDLFERACAMERNAELRTVKGLGRSFSWAEYIKYRRQQPSLKDHFIETIQEPCECKD
jgi:hypothetical protein